MSVVSIGNRRHTITPDDHGNHLELGPAAPLSFTGTWSLQLNASLDFQGSVVVVAHEAGAAAQDANLPFVPIPYRRVAVAGVASDRAIVSDPVVGGSIIEIPANGLSVALLVACGAGKCDVVSLPLNGPST